MNGAAVGNKTLTHNRNHNTKLIRCLKNPNSTRKCKYHQFQRKLRVYLKIKVQYWLFEAAGICACAQI